MERFTYESNGTTYRIAVGTGGEFAAEIQNLIHFLESRAHVQKHFLECNVPKARLIAAAFSGSDIVAICMLKADNALHTRRVMENSGHSMPNDALELGYAATHEYHRGRGLNALLNRELLARTPGTVYATVRVGNEPEERSLTSCGFQCVGSAGQGTTGMLSLWVRNASAPAADDRGREQDA